MDQAIEARLQRMLDERDIETVLKLYCRAIDRGDMELLKSLYHPDGTDDHGVFSGNAQHFAEYIIPSLREMTADGFHTVTHIAIEVEGDRATSEAYYWAYQQFYGGEAKVRAFFGDQYADEQRQRGTLDGFHDYLCGGRYLDVFERREGAWKILRRRITNEWSIAQPGSHIVDQGHIALVNLPGRRDRQDPVYMLRQMAGSAMADA